VSQEWRLWRRQAFILASIEARRRLLGRGSIAVLVLAGSALFLGVVWMVFLSAAARGDVGRTTAEFAEKFHYFLLLFVIFFGCAFLFTNLFRGEILDRSLHYTLLAPLRREVVVAGKYLGALLVSVLVFGATTLGTMVLFYLANGPARAAAYLLSGTGLAAAGSYLLVVALACAGYGALFLLFGLLFRNPAVPAALLLLWEYLIPFLPPALKCFSVAYPLSSLLPVPLKHGPFSILAEPPPPLLAVTGLIVVSAALLAVAGWRARRLEISYAAE
jgi:ABC-type transport system involved in multi-copper enzyme maturation permease subunit